MLTSVFTPKKVTSFMNGDISRKPNAENLRIEEPVEPIYKGLNYRREQQSASNLITNSKSYFEIR